MNREPKSWQERLLYFAARRIGPLIVRLLAMTLRFERVGVEHHEAGMLSEKNFIFAVYHGRMFGSVWYHRGGNITTLVSRSKDGEIVSRLVEGIGHHTVRGSSNDGAVAGLKSIIKALRRGPVAMMVDGPKGPRGVVKVGSVAIAKVGGAPIVPMVASAWPCWEFNSWDRFQLPRPFARVRIGYGEPLIVPKTAKKEDLEAYRMELQRRMEALLEELDRQMRRDGKR